MVRMDRLRKRLAAKREVTDDFQAPKHGVRFSLKTLESSVAEDYKIYIKSKYWTARRDAYYEKYKKECAACYAIGATIDLNHTYYGDLGQERDEDLIPFCRFHHQDFHKKYGVAFDMREACGIYIIRERQRLLENPVADLTYLKTEEIEGSHSMAAFLEAAANPIWRLLALIGINKS